MAKSHLDQGVADPASYPRSASQPFASAKACNFEFKPPFGHAAHAFTAPADHQPRPRDFGKNHRSRSICSLEV